MAYIGRDISNLSDRVVLDSITTSATATYNLLLNSVAFVPSSAESLTVSLNGVIQKPQGSYTVSGSTIVFDSALTSSDVIDFILAERAITLTTVGSGSVGTSQLADDAVTTAKINDGAVTSAKLDSGLGLGKIGQVIQTYKTDTFSTSSGSFVDVTGLSVSITPSATTSKILISLTAIIAQGTTGWNVYTQLLRDSTVVGSSTGGTSTQNFAGALFAGTAYVETIAVNYLDSPSSTSAITYKIQAKTGGSKTGYFGRRGDSTSDGFPSSLTAMEVLA